MISAAHESYKKDGYYIQKNILSKDALLNILHEFDIMLVQQLNYMGSKEKSSSDIQIVHAHMRKLHQINNPAYLQSLRVWAKLFSLQALIMHDDIVKMIQTIGINLLLFQTTPVVHVIANDLKIIGGYHGVGVHQDWPALQSGLDTITIWFPFMDVDKHNFPVELIPGSHHFGLYPGKPAQNIYEIDSTYYDEADFVPMEMSMGDVLFMSNFTLHRTGMQGDHRVRIAGSARYENGSEKTFIERMYPSAQKRVIERELFQRNFPEKHHFQKIFTV